MAEVIGALEAISLASSLLQFIELGVTICRSAYKNADGFADELQDTRHWTDQLQSLKQSIAKSEDYQVTAETLEEDKKIIRIGQECDDIAMKLIDVLRDYRAKGKGATKLYTSVKGTFLYMMGGKDRVEELRKRLESYHKLLSDQVLFSLQTRYNRLDSHMRELKANDMKQLEAARDRHQELLDVTERNHAETSETLHVMRDKVDEIVLSLSPAPSYQSSWGPPMIPSQGGTAVLSFHEAIRKEDLHGFSLALGQLSLGKVNIDAQDASGRTALHLAADGHIGLCERLLKAGASLNAQDSQGRTPLHYSVQGDHVEITRLLLANGAIAAIEDHSGAPAASCATEKGIVRLMLTEGVTAEGMGRILLEMTRRNDVEAVKQLLESGAQVNSQGTDGYSALILAAMRGYLEIARELIKHPRVDLEIRDAGNGDTALVHALKSTPARLDIAAALGDAGADVEAEGAQGHRPLHWFCQHPKPSAVDWLLKANANVHHRDKNGRTPLMLCAMERKNADEACRSMQLLLQQGADTETRSPGPHKGFTALSCAAIYGRQEQAELLIRAGANVNTMGADGWTPLAETCFRGFRDIAHALLKNGAYVDTRNASDDTPLTLACRKGHADCVQLLLQHGAKTSVRAQCFRTPLLVATENRHREIMKLLLEHGVDVNAQDERGRTAVLLLATDDTRRAGASNDQRNASRFACARLLLEHGPDISLTNKKGWRCLDEAAFHGFPNLVRAFLKAGADANARDRGSSSRGGDGGEEADVKEDGLCIPRRSTPLFKAARANRLAICKMLVEEGRADVNMQDERGRTALLVADDTGVKEYLYQAGTQQQSVQALAILNGASSAAGDGCAGHDGLNG